MKKTVLITGGTSGIGKEIAILFAKNSWDVLLHYHSLEKKAKDIKKNIESFGVFCRLLKADLSQEKQIDTFINKLKRFRIDTLINNAGTYISSRHFNELTMSDIINTFTVNVFSHMLISAKLFMQMKERRFGRIVNISSIAAKYGGSSYSMHYGCSKLALEGITKTIAREGAKYNVLVNTVRPGVIDTDFHKKFPKDLKKRIAMIPIGKMGSPADIADIVFYLGSERNNFITNEIITIAGGE